MSKVISGKFRNKRIDINGDIILNWNDRFKINKDTVSSYEIINQDTRKSGKSALGRGLVGGALLGPLGALAGGLSAKNKTKYILSIKYEDGGNSVLELSSKDFNLIITKLK